MSHSAFDIERKRNQSKSYEISVIGTDFIIVNVECLPDSLWISSSAQSAFLLLDIQCCVHGQFTLVNCYLFYYIYNIVVQVFCHLLIGFKLTDSAHSVNIFKFQVSFLNLHTQCTLKVRTKVRSKQSSNI